MLSKERHQTATRPIIAFKTASFRRCYGGEFVPEHLQHWLRRVGVKPIQIYPGSPRDNGYNERFNASLRREVLNAEWFQSVKQAQVTINAWLKEYKHIRPHHSLGMRPPVPETLSEKSKTSGTVIRGQTFLPFLTLTATRAIPPEHHFSPFHARPNLFLAKPQHLLRLNRGVVLRVLIVTENYPDHPRAPERTVRMDRKTMMQ